MDEHSRTDKQEQRTDHSGYESDWSDSTLTDTEESSDTIELEGKDSRRIKWFLTGAKYGAKMSKHKTVLRNKGYIGNLSLGANNQGALSSFLYSTDAHEITGKPSLYKEGKSMINNLEKLQTKPVAHETRHNILHMACKDGNLESVTDIVSRNIVNIDSRGNDGLTPLMVAAENGEKEIFHFLISQGCDDSLVDDNGNNSIHIACYLGKLEIVEYIIKHKIAGLEIRGQNGRTPLMAATQNCQKHVADFLIRQNGDLSTVDKNDDTILHIACYGGNVAMIDYILSLDIISLERRGQFGRTPVMAAAQRGQKCAFDNLVAKGCDLFVADYNGDNILHVACNGNSLAMAAFLLDETKIDIESRGHYGWTPVVLAAHQNYKSLVAFFVSKGCDLTVVDSDGDTILHNVCYNGSTDVAEYLFSRQTVGIDDRGHFGRTPVMAAAMKGHKDIFEMLVQKGCDLSIIDGNGDTILHVACYSNCLYIIDFILCKRIANLESRGLNGWTPVMVAVHAGHLETADYLQKKGCDLSTTDQNGHNILHLACFGGSVNIVKYIISLKVVGVESKGQFGRTPLMSAVQEGHQEVFDFLISIGCNHMYSDEHDDNILHVACYSGSMTMVEYIISKGMILIDSRGQWGRTPAMTAALNNETNIVEYLFNSRCDMFTTDNHNNNILHIACFGGALKTIEYIVSLNIFSLECKGQMGRTPLLAAIQCNNAEVIDLLISKGGDILVLDDNGDNVLHVASYAGCDVMIQYILSKELVPVESRGQFDRTAVLTAAGNGHVKVVDILIDNGCDVSANDKHLNNILHVACFGGSVQMVQYIHLRDMVDIESKNQNGMTPVMAAAENGHFDVVDFLVQKTCNLSVVDKSGDNVMHKACVKGNVDLVKYLVAKGNDDFNTQNSIGNTPAKIALLNEQVNCFELLLSNGYVV